MPRYTSVMNATGGSAVSKLSGSTTSMTSVIGQLAVGKHSTSILTPDLTSSSVTIAIGPLVASIL
jgi:hypothetical protein